MTLRAVIWCAVSTQAQAEDEKVSLPQQEADALALCERHGWQVIAILKVSGHSRRYIDIYECARDMANEGITAFKDLITLWEQRAFDVLIVRDASRFARTQALHAYVVERTINIGAYIHSLHDGVIDEHNYRMWISMGGYSAAGEIDRLVKGRKAAMPSIAQRGLPVSSVTVMSHKVERDASGRAQQQVVDESLRRLWDDLAALILEGIPWHKMEAELYQRFGHANPFGEAYHKGKFNKLVNTPAFWGHTAMHHRGKGGIGEYKSGAWIYESGHTVPRGVRIYYNTHEAVYTGELAARIKAELKRRSENIHGKATPDKTYRFSGLLICADCGYNLSKYGKNGWVGMRCMSKYQQTGKRPDCDNTALIAEKNIQAHLDHLLRKMLIAGTPEGFLSDEQDIETIAKRLEQIQTEINNLERQIERMILQQASATEDVQEIYSRQIAKEGGRLKVLKEHRKELQHQVSALDKIDRQMAFDDLMTLSVDNLWDQEDRWINQLLHRLMGRKRFVVQDGKIIGAADALKHSRRY